MHRIGSVQRKILIALLGGIALGLSGSPRQYFRTLRLLRKDWQKVNQQNFERTIRKLAKEKLVEEKTLSDGSIKLVLTKAGKEEACRLNFFGSSIKFRNPKRWDGKWRIILFDIPEKERVFRDILREHLYDLRFYKFQLSAFVSPYPFEKQISELVSLYSAEPYVRVITAVKIDNETKIKKHFFKK